MSYWKDSHVQANCAVWIIVILKRGFALFVLFKLWRTAINAAKENCTAYYRISKNLHRNPYGL